LQAPKIYTNTLNTELGSNALFVTPLLLETVLGNELVTPLIFFFITVTVKYSYILSE